MNKSDLAYRIKHENNGIDEYIIDNFIESVLRELKLALSLGKRIEIRGFGAFSVRTRQKRAGRNPRTGDFVCVSEKKVPFFRMGKPLQERLNRKFH